MKNNMVMVDGSESLFIVERLQNGNYKIGAYMQDDSENGTGSKIWWNTERKQNGDLIEKRNPMEPIKTYNYLKELARKVILKFEEQN